MIQGATFRKSANIYSRSTAISPMSVKIVEISCFRKHDQFTRMFSNKFMFCNSIRSYFDSFRDKASDRAK